MAGTGLLATGLWDLMAWRAVTGLGYAATFVACQGFVIESTGDRDRAQGTAMMVSGIMPADVCGPAIGGIVAVHGGDADRSEESRVGKACVRRGRSRWSTSHEKNTTNKT